MIFEIDEIELFKATLTAAAVCDVRQYINGVLFTKGGFAVATDGHQLVKTRCSNYQGDDIILSPNRKVPAKTHYIEIDTETLIVRYLGINRGEVSLGRAEKIDGKYPDYTRAIPEIHKEPAGPSLYMFNPQLCSDIQIAGKFSGFHFNVADKDKPIRFSPFKLEDEKFVGVMMPMRM